PVLREENADSDPPRNSDEGRDENHEPGAGKGVRKATAELSHRSWQMSEKRPAHGGKSANARVSEHADQRQDRHERRGGQKRARQAAPELPGAVARIERENGSG